MAKRKKAKVIHYHYNRQALMKSITNVIGIDSSLTGFAFCKWIVNNHAPEPPVRISTDSDIHHFERYRAIINRIMPEVSPTTLVFMEGYAFGAAAGQNMIDLAGLGEMVRMGIYRKTGIEPIMIAPGQLKKFISGKGNLKKDLVCMKVLSGFAMEFETTDEAESFCLATLGLKVVWGGEDGLTKYQLDVITDVRREWFS